jgi:hypothetical protein
MSRLRFKWEALPIESLFSVEIRHISQKTYFPSPVTRLPYMLYGIKLKPSGPIPFREIKISPLEIRLLGLKTRAVHITALSLLMGSYSCQDMRVFAGCRSTFLHRWGKLLVSI